jgi:flavin-dependent dehydrogenase
MSVCEVIVVGAGPAGSAVSCLLAERGINTVLIEEKRMPREKLCGAFITPECFPTLHRLGALDQILSAGAQRISDLRLVAPSGRAVTTSISAISAGGGKRGLSLSRRRFDEILIDRARRAGAVVLEGMAVKRALFSDNNASLDKTWPGNACVGNARGVECVSLPTGAMRVFEAPLIIDASGRNSRLSLAPGERIAARKGGRLYALKAHLQNVVLPSGIVELYFYASGYGGLSRIEGGLVNLCFITSERSIREASGDPTCVMRQTLMKNPVASQRLSGATVAGKWLSAGPLSFGHRPFRRNGIIAIGDAAGMIDPFTGTGIQIALRSGEILADSVIYELAGCDEHMKRPHAPLGSGARRSMPFDAVERVRDLYERQYEAEFHNRMAVAAAFRLAAFSPRAAGLAATLFAMAPGVANRALKGTRVGKGGRRSLAAPDTRFDQIMELSAPDGVSVE